MYVKAENTLSKFYQEIIEEELNVKEVKFSDDVRAFTTYTFKPQLKTLGRRFGKDINTVRELLSNIDGNEAMDSLNNTVVLTLNVNGTDEEFVKDDLLIEMTQKLGFVSADDRGITVVLDINLTEELIEEGFVREIISKIQTMRKDAGFEVMDKIVIYAEGNDKIEKIITNNGEFIKVEVLADDIVIGKTCGSVKEWNLNGEKVTLGVEKK